LERWLAAALDYVPRWLDYQMRLTGQPGCTVSVVVRGKVVLDGPLRDVFYESEALKQAGVIPPQTVRFAESIPALRDLHPLGPNDLALRLGLAPELVA